MKERRFEAQEGLDIAGFKNGGKKNKNKKP